MPHKDILNWLAILPPEHTLWYTDSGPFSVRTIQEQTLRLRAKFPFLHNQAVALSIEQPAVLSQWMIALAGFASRQLFALPEINDNTLAHFLAVTGTRYHLIATTTTQPASSPEDLHIETLATPPPPPPPPPPPDAPPDPSETRWIIPTSGTTGTPKLISHTLDSLAATMRRSERAAQLTWGLLYDIRRFAGLQVWLQSLFSGAGLIFVDRTQPLSYQLQQLVQHGCNALSATPTLWRKLMMLPSVAQLNLKQITLGGEIIDQSTLDAIHARFPHAQITHIYASTEAGACFSVKDRQAGFPTSYLSGLGSGLEMRVSSEGHLLIRRPTYQQNLLGSTQTSLSDSEGWLDTGDMVEQRGDRLYFLGRASGSINVGGSKVHPEEVEQIILEIPEVALCAISGRPNPITGNLVQATLVVQPGVDAEMIKKNVRTYCRERLPAYKVPALIEIRDTLETSAAGKLAKPASLPTES